MAVFVSTSCFASLLHSRFTSLTVVVAVGVPVLVGVDVSDVDGVVDADVDGDDVPDVLDVPVVVPVLDGEDVPVLDWGFGSSQRVPVNCWLH